MKQQLLDMMRQCQKEPVVINWTATLTWLALVAAVIGFWIGAILCVI